MPKWLSGILLILFIVFPNEVREGTKSGLDNAFLVLVPSLFPYMVISQIFINTGGAEYISGMLYRPINFFTGLTRKGTAIYLLSLFCGYPTGARLSAMAYDNNEIDKNETLKLFAMGNVPGFGFAVLFLGAAVFQNLQMGIKAYLSFVAASFLLGFIMSFFIKGKELKTNKNQFLTFENSIVKSISDSSVSIISVISYVCFFSSIINILQKFCINPLVFSIFASFLEITTGIKNLTEVINEPTAFIIFFTGFSGLSIIFQSLSFQKNKAVNIYSFMILRLIFGLLSAIIFILIN